MAEVTTADGPAAEIDKSEAAEAAEAAPATSDPSDAGDLTAGSDAWLRELWQYIAPAVVFLGVRAVGLLWLANLAGLYDRSFTELLSKWDGRWMLGIAAGWYSDVPDGLTDAFGHRTDETPLAFFPGYPAAVSFIRFVTGTSSLPSGIAVSLAAGVFLAYGLVALGEQVPGGSRRVGLILVALVAAAPMGIVWSMTYSEGLFCAFSVWALVSVLRRNWVLAGVCAAFAGTIRPTSGALLLAVGAAMLLAAFRRQDGWRPWAGGVIAPLGLLGYLVYVAVRLGRPDGWFGLQQRGWNSQFDAGAATVKFSYSTLTQGKSILESGTVFVLAGALVLLVVCIRTRVPWPLWVYAAGVLVMDLGSNGLMNSKARLALPAVTLLVPVALALAKRRRGTAIAVLVAATLLSAWFGAYSLTGWNYAI